MQLVPDFFSFLKKLSSWVSWQFSLWFHMLNFRVCYLDILMLLCRFSKYFQYLNIHADCFPFFFLDNSLFDLTCWIFVFFILKFIWIPEIPKMLDLHYRKMQIAFRFLTFVTIFRLISHGNVSCPCSNPLCISFWNPT